MPAWQWHVFLGDTPPRLAFCQMAPPDGAEPRSARRWRVPLCSTGHRACTQISIVPPFPASVLVCQCEQGYQSGFMAGVADSGFGQCPPGEGC